MKITVSQQSLDNALTFLSEIVAKRTTMPILGCVLLSAESGKLFLSATDLNVSARTVIGAAIESPGKALVNAKKLKEILQVVIGNLTMEVIKGTSNISISSGKAKFKLPGLAPDQAPEWTGRVFEGEPFIEFGAADFMRAIRSVVFAVPEEGGRYVLSGFLIKGGDFVATDGYRLPVYWAEWAGEIPEVIIPKRVGQLLMNTIGSEGKMRMAQRENLMLFSFGSWEVCAIKQEGKFPEYKKVIPDEDSLTMRATFNAKTFSEHLNRVLVCADDEKKTVKLTFSDGLVKFDTTSRSSEEAADEMDISGGSDLIIAFNCKGMIEMLSTMEGEVEFGAKDANSIALVRKNSDYLCAIAPMRF